MTQPDPPPHLSKINMSRKISMNVANNRQMIMSLYEKFAHSNKQKAMHIVLSRNTILTKREIKGRKKKAANWGIAVLGYQLKY